MSTDSFSSLFSFIFLCSLSISTALAQHEAPGLLPEADLIVVVENLRLTGGTLRVSLFQSESGFPDDPSQAVLYDTVTVRRAYEELHFRGLTPGLYGLGVLHDEDENGVMSFSTFGIPNEGYACSNNARGFMGPPKFQKAAFQVPPGVSVHRVRMRY